MALVAAASCARPCWPDICQLVCDSLAAPAGNEALASHLSLPLRAAKELCSAAIGSEESGVTEERGRSSGVG